jgi:hypothetical protein
MISACALVALFSSCSSQLERRSHVDRDVKVAYIGEMTAIRAQEILSKIKVKMRFEEISKVIPLSTKAQIGDVMHGAMWYEVPLGSGYSVQLGFEHPAVGQEFENCRLKYPPELKQKN